MKTLNPLAAAFLLLASSASAQLLSGPSGGGFSMTGGNGGNSNPFSLAGSGSGGTIPDASFTCSSMENIHIPFASCTEAQLADRRRFNGECPPQSTACREYLQRALSGTNPPGMVAAYDPPPGRQWASPDCQRIPCRLADSPSTTPSPRAAPGVGAVESGLPYDQQPGFIGPPAPPPSNTPPAFSAAEFQGELAAARSDNQYPVVDLGDNRFGVVLEDGTVSVCGRGGCVPRPASEFPNLADQIQAATSRNSGADSINSDNPSGFRKSSNPPSTPPGGSGRFSQGTPPPADDVASNPSSEAKASGGDAGSFFRSNGGGAGARAGGTTGGGFTAAAAGDQEEAIATEAAELDGVFTYIKTQEIKASIDKTAGAVASGADGTFVTPANTPDANAGNLQFKGTQSGANR